MNPAQTTIPAALETVRKRQARTMTVDALIFSANDCNEAATMAEELERAGCQVSKTGGYYRDEATIYRAELHRRNAI